MALYLSSSEGDVNPSFVSPYTGKHVHLIICPSHQVSVYYLLWFNQYFTIIIAEEHGFSSISIKKYW